MKKGINCCPVERICIPCAFDMEQTIYLVRCRGDGKRDVCARCGKHTMTLKYQYTMKGAELIRRGLVDAPPQ